MVCGPSPLLPVVNDEDGLQHDPLLAPTKEEAIAEACKLRFPANFIFSSATSAYQVEGGIVDTNWNRWEEQKTRKDGQETIKRGERAGRACDMWNMFETVDLTLIQELGLGSFRFSVEWSRVEPTEGQYDEAALDRYESWCKKLRAAGIEPCVTLLHFTEPGWFIDKGGWEERKNVPNFVSFCEVVVKRLAPHCSMWCTLNEPVGCCANGWLAGIHPPGRQGALRPMLKALFHMLLGHRDVARAIRDASPAAPADKPMWIMIANNIVWFEAKYRFNALARLVAFFLNLLFNFCVSDLCTRGRLFLPFHLFFCLFGIRKDMTSLKGTVTHIGVNNYARVQLRMECLKCCMGDGSTDDALPSPTTTARIPEDGAELRTTVPPPAASDAEGEAAKLTTAAKREIRGVGQGGVASGEQNVGGACLSGDPHNPRFEMSDMEWDLCPSSLGKALRSFWQRYKLPLLVTESGIADDDLDDQRRVRYLAGCLRAVHAAIQDGVDVRGYTYWSLLDNFEWAEGFRPRFGLFRIDYETMERKETGGLRLYRDVIQLHRAGNQAEGSPSRVVVDPVTGAVTAGAVELSEAVTPKARADSGSGERGVERRPTPPLAASRGAKPVPGCPEVAVGIPLEAEVEPELEAVPETN